MKTIPAHTGQADGIATYNPHDVQFSNRRKPTPLLLIERFVSQ